MAVLSTASFALFNIRLFFSLISEQGKLKLELHIGSASKELTITLDGDSLSDDTWHSVRFKRRGMILTLGVDGEKPAIGEFIKVDHIV